MPTARPPGRAMNVSHFFAETLHGLHAVVLERPEILDRAFDLGDEVVGEFVDGRGVRGKGNEFDATIHEETIERRGQCLVRHKLASRLRFFRHVSALAPPPPPPPPPAEL